MHRRDDSNEGTWPTFLRLPVSTRPSVTSPGAQCRLLAFVIADSKALKTVFMADKSSATDEQAPTAPIPATTPPEAKAEAEAEDSDPDFDDLDGS